MSFDKATHDFMMPLLPIVKLVLKSPQHKYLAMGVDFGFRLESFLLLILKEYTKIKNKYKKKQQKANSSSMGMSMFPNSADFRFSLKGIQI